MPMSQSDVDRFRSFAERYVITRSPSFTSTDPRKDAWTAVQDAVCIYNNIARVAYDKFGPQQAGASQAAPNVQQVSKGAPRVAPEFDIYTIP